MCSRLFAQGNNSVTISPSAPTPASTAVISQYILSGGVTCTLEYSDPSEFVQDTILVVLYGRIESVSAPFKILLRQNYVPQQIIPLKHFVVQTVSMLQFMDAFGSFMESNLVSSDPGAFPISSFRDANGNLRLPAGDYNICFEARMVSSTTRMITDTIVGDGCAKLPFTVTCTQSANSAVINTMINLPINPVISQFISTGGINSSIQYTDPTGCINSQANLYGKIERVLPSPFSITVNRNFQQNPIRLIPPGNLIQVSPGQQSAAFNNFNEGTLIVSGTDIDSIKDANNNIRLPDGNYRICFSAAYTDSGGNASDPNAGCTNFTLGCASTNGLQINTIVKPLANPIVSQMLLNGEVISTLQNKNPGNCNAPIQVKLFGKIERISPSSFSISLNPDYQQQIPATLTSGGLLQLTPAQQSDAFGNFNESNLVTEGIDLASIKDANNNIKLPDGNYRICFYARYITANGTLAGNASDPNLGCGTFNICYQAGGAPQFTQPVSNLNINSDFSVIQPASPVTFTWTPPQSTCGLPAGGFNYDFEIWELFPNQNVTDAVNNPFVFRKTSLPATTFLLDTNLYRNVLEEGKRYAIRVRALSTNPGSPVEIDNNGYSRIEVFQYGGSSLISQTGTIPDPHDYYILFRERKSDMWDDVYRAYKSHLRGDTLVPIEEYIAFALAENGTAYNLDAIELFLMLNPQLADVKKVKISYKAILPVFPEVAETKVANFNKEHQVNLEPNSTGKNKFLNFLDTLNNYKGTIPANAVKLTNDVVERLNNIKGDIDSVDQVTVNYINMTLSEILYELRLYANGMNNNQYNQLQGMVSTLMELTTQSLNGTSLLYKILLEKKSSMSSSRYINETGPKKISLSDYLFSIDDGDNTGGLLAVIVKQLLPFDVVVFRASANRPKPVFDAPDLTATYRIFYNLSTLHNYKNPEINAKSTSRLASTVQVSLPSNTRFTFWTLNMINHKMTSAEDVDLRDVLLNNRKNYPDLKKPSIVLKVN